MFTVYHHSEITGSTWIVSFGPDFETKQCYLISRGGKCTKVILSRQRDWLLWLFLNKTYELGKEN